MNAHTRTFKQGETNISDSITKWGILCTTCSTNKNWISNKSDILGGSLTPKPLKLKSEIRGSELR